MISRRLRIRGTVQGVYYRESMRQRADQWGVTGWVRNRMDGTVEAVLQGETENVERLIDWARRGPPAARDDGVDVAADDDEPRHESFDKKPTS